MHGLQKIESRLAFLMGCGASVALLFMMISTALDATSRSLLNFPLPGVYEFSEIAMAIIVYLGLLWTQYDRKHIRVSLISESRTPRLRLIWESVAWLFAALFLIAIAIPSIEGAYISTLEREFRWGIMQMPIWWVKVIVAVGLFLAFLQMMLHFIISIYSALGESHD